MTGFAPHFLSPISHPLFLISFLFLTLLTACTSTRPVAKIGLLAPFEGLYRATGYEALSAMRAAIAETETGALHVLPLALDTSADPAQAERALQKLRQDPALIAVVGPIVAREAADVFAASEAMPEPLWFPHPAEPPLAIFVAAVAAAVESKDGAGIAFAGTDEPWLRHQVSMWRQSVDVPLRVVTNAAQVRDDEVVAWLGNPAAGALFLADLRQTYPQMPFWTTTAGGDPVFYRHAAALLDTAALGPIYWTAWLDANYTDWAQARTSDSPLAYAVYRATQMALADQTHIELTPVPPQLTIFVLDADGTSRPVSAES